MDDVNGTEQELALVYTNASEDVIFVNEYFLDLMHYQRRVQVLGEKLREVLSLEAQTADEVWKRVKESGRVEHDMVRVRPAGNGEVEVAFSGVANYDLNRNFIGADFTLTNLLETSMLEKRPPSDHGILINVHAAQLTRKGGFSLEDSQLAVYFVSHLQALHLLSARLMGLKMQQSLGERLNGLATEHGWPVRIEEGYVDFSAPIGDIIAYQQLLNEAVSYMTNMIGNRVISAEMARIDETMDTQTLERAASAGLRFFEVG